MSQPNPILQYFTYAHLAEPLASISQPFCTLAHHLAATLPPSAETSAGLRKLLEAKDCAVRAALTPPPVVVGHSPTGEPKHYGEKA